MTRDVVLCLCDLTGIMAEPWVEHGYKAVLVDPQHGLDRIEGSVLKLAKTVEEALPIIQRLIDTRSIALVAGFPPCTDLAVSGAQWFPRKYEQDHMFQAKAVAVAEQCRTIGKASGAPWMVENPVSVLSNVFGKPSFTFDPYQFTSFEPADNYTKKTCIWSGGGFQMPLPAQDDTLGEPDPNHIWHMSGKDRANQRSKTPRGFARAVYQANCREWTKEIYGHDD
ncbi:hypothetical protein [Bifidobacterium platyrrhinorum]|uniref:DNA cytosine methyltransferase n=1 Tax=Bifidobacterium platyrrhinorum TaxID=2661628 RepID=A0A6L9SUB7_9BIFI|nr:hypothetical protein [Bifidobacterium platyrrhinorum]NEG55423.1 hypothetical protein [Bifidobacterium platyrrhinorum]